jgi:putative transposase
MDNRSQRLAHSKWDGKYHLIFIPNRRRRQLSGQSRRQWGPLFHALARQKEGQIIAGPVRPEHVHRGIAIPPKVAGAQGSGVLKGKSARALARQVGGKERNCTGEHFWARGYAVATVGVELEQVRADMREHEDADTDGEGSF